MTAFHEVEFPLPVAAGALSGPTRRTDVVVSAGGYEERNQRWANSRRRYDVSVGIRHIKDLHQVIDFFEDRRGRLTGFRFCDPLDNRSSEPTEPVTPTDQRLGTADGSATDFQLVKRYGSSNEWVRAIKKPVSGTVRVSLDNVEQLSGRSLDDTTGVVTFTSAPTDGVVVKAGFRFHVPVRFEEDQVRAKIDGNHVASVSAITLIEVRT